MLLVVKHFEESFLKMDSSDDEDISNSLECCVCLDICSIPIEQCKNGHNICQSHLPYLLEGTCPICRVPYSQGSVRNLLAEKLILKRRKKNEATVSKSSITVKAAPLATSQQRNARCKEIGYCIYNCEGCVYFNLLNQARKLHERDCLFRPIRCCLAFDGCFNAQINYSDYIHHLKTRHNVFSVSSSHYTRQYNTKGGKLVRNGSSKLFIIEAFGKEFLIQTTQGNDKLYVWSGIHGTTTIGVDYDVQFKLVTCAQSDQRFTWYSRILTSSRQDEPPMYNNGSQCFTMKISEVFANLNSKPRTPFAKFWSLDVTISCTQAAAQSSSGFRAESNVTDTRSVFNPPPPFPLRSTASSSRTVHASFGRASPINGTNIERHETAAISTWNQIASPQRSTMGNNSSATSRILSEFTRDFYNVGPREDLGLPGLRLGEQRDPIRASIRNSVFNPQPGASVTPGITAQVSTSSPTRNVTSTSSFRNGILRNGGNIQPCLGTSPNAETSSSDYSRNRTSSRMFQRLSGNNEKCTIL